FGSTARLWSIQSGRTKNRRSTFEGTSTEELEVFDRRTGSIPQGSSRVQARNTQDCALRLEKLGTTNYAIVAGCVGRRSPTTPFNMVGTLSRSRMRIPVRVSGTLSQKNG